MSIQKGVQKALLAQSEITDLTTSIFVNTIPQFKQLPAIVIKKTGGNQYNTLGGGDYDDMKSAYFDIECIALTEREAIEIADAVMETMADYTGPMDDQTCLASIHQDDESDVEPTVIPSAKNIHSEFVRFLFQYVRTE